MLILAQRFEFCNSCVVSTLASCGRLLAIVPDLANRPRQLVFLTPIDSQLNDFLNEIHQIARLEPSLVERIDEDLDLHDSYFDFLARRYNQIREFAPAFLHAFKFRSNRNSDALLQAVELLQNLNQGRRRAVPTDAPLKFAPAMWHPGIRIA
jgi:hypothetical protein